MSEPRKIDPVEEMRAFLDDVRGIAPLTVESTPDGGITSVTIGATEKLNEISDSAQSHGLLLVYDGLALRVIPVNPEALPTVEAGVPE